MNANMLSIAQTELLATAKEAAVRSYSPYSRYRVGAAVLSGGRHFSGANIENASSNLGICAERVAIAHARMNGATEVQGLAVYCLDAILGDKPEQMGQTLPCGACRQWLAELAPDAWIVTNGSAAPLRLADLFPLPFRLPDGPK